MCMDTTTILTERAKENPRVCENAIRVATMAADLSQLVGADEAIDAVAEYLGVKREIVIISLAIARDLLSE